MATFTFSESAATGNVVVSDVGGTAGATPLTYTVPAGRHHWTATHDRQRADRDLLLAFGQWLDGRLKADGVISGGDGSTFALASGQVAESAY